MADIDIMDVEAGAFTGEASEFDDVEVKGYYVSPKSDEKKVVIPSPPKVTMMKINPRDGILYVTKKVIDDSYEKLDSLKAYCKEEKKVFVIPALREDEEGALNDLAAAYQWMLGNNKLLNVKKLEIQLKAEPACMELAEKFIEFAEDEMDVEFEEAEEYEI